MFGPTVSPRFVQSGKGRIVSDPDLLTCPGLLWSGPFPSMAATNKHLAQSNKSRRRGEATKKREISQKPDGGTTNILLTDENGKQVANVLVSCPTTCRPHRPRQGPPRLSHVAAMGAAAKAGPAGAVKMVSACHTLT